MVQELTNRSTITGEFIFAAVIGRAIYGACQVFSIVFAIKLGITVVMLSALDLTA